MRLQMVNLTISLSEETVKRLRRAVKERYGGKKGALSNLIQEALRGHLDSLETVPSSQRFRALRDEKVVAEADSLEDIAAKLRGLGIDPREVRIVSSEDLSPVARAGFRARAV